MLGSKMTSIFKKFQWLLVETSNQSHTHTITGFIIDQPYIMDYFTHCLITVQNTLPRSTKRYRKDN